MSYFMTVSGSPPTNRPEVEFLPISQSQDYIRDLAPKLAQQDGAPLFLAHDRQTGTSSDFVIDGETHFDTTGSLSGCPLHKILRDCVGSCDAFRIWWAGNEPDDLSRVTPGATWAEVVATVSEQIANQTDIAVRWMKELVNE